FIGEVIAETRQWMNEHGYKSFSDMRDKLIPHVKTSKEVTLYTGYAQIKCPDAIAPCLAVCPKAIDVQSLLKSLAENKWEKAYQLAAGSEYCASCDAPCEKACFKGQISKNLSIKDLVLYVREKAAAAGASIAEKAEGRITGRTLAKPSDILPNRIVPGTEKTIRKPKSDTEAMAEAKRCMRCGCGNGCRLCADLCCEFAIELNSEKQMEINKEKCTACGMCYNMCPNRNIHMVKLALKTD
ncbi:4Fe-4S binding protein, partial [Desulfovibrio sp. OttesenSCG-928-C14]|nr:4Fe-4S binding protein [Desulfovibrio sp. OttesenSCG-928-C14]